MPDSPLANADGGKEQVIEAGSGKTKVRRSIPGDFSYTPTYGKLKTALENIVNAERPETFSKDFLAAYLGVSGGSATPIPPILKRMGFLSSDSRPTELYAKFQNSSLRAGAALEGLKKAFPQLYRKHTYIHTLPDEEVKNILVEITGLKKNDPVLSQIFGTFDALRSFVPKNFSGKNPASMSHVNEDDSAVVAAESPSQLSYAGSGVLGLSYHINIVLPETKDVAVFNAIFQSLKANLLS